MSTQQKASGGGRKAKSSGLKDAGGVAVSEQNNNNQTQIQNIKKHNNVNAKDVVNNNTADQPKTEKEKHAKVSYSYTFGDPNWLPGKRTREIIPVDDCLR